MAARREARARSAAAVIVKGIANEPSCKRQEGGPG